MFRILSEPVAPSYFTTALSTLEHFGTERSSVSINRATIFFILQVLNDLIIVWQRSTLRN